MVVPQRAFLRLRQKYFRTRNCFRWRSWKTEMITCLRSSGTNLKIRNACSALLVFSAFVHNLVNKMPLRSQLVIFSKVSFVYQHFYLIYSNSHIYSGRRMCSEKFRNKLYIEKNAKCFQKTLLFWPFEGRAEGGRLDFERWVA